MGIIERTLHGRFPVDLRWRYWLILVVIGMITFHGIGAWHLQRGLNIFREYCLCDLNRITRTTLFTEGAVIWLNWSKGSELKYLVCRSLCP